jgi:hypothetical protein
MYDEVLGNIDVIFFCVTILLNVSSNARNQENLETLEIQPTRFCFFIIILL